MNMIDSSVQSAPLTPVDTEPHTTLINENRRYSGTGGVSEENREEGFRPAFQDLETGKIYLSRTRDGRCASLHLLDGLDDEVVIARCPQGRVTAIKQSVVAGFIRCEEFFTRDQAAAALG